MLADVYGRRGGRASRGRIEARVHVAHALEEAEGSNGFKIARVRYFWSMEDEKGSKGSGR